MSQKTTVVEGRRIPIGDDPTHDYARDYRRSRNWTAQQISCHRCKKDMRATGRAVSPLYGTIGQVFECDCGAGITVYPVVAG